MMKSTANVKPGTEYSRSYNSLRGVDLRCGTDCGEGFAYLKNMYIDYEAGGGVVESIPGYRQIIGLGGAPHSIFSKRVSSGKKYALIHAGASLFGYDTATSNSGAAPKEITTLKNADSFSFSLGKDLYIIDGEDITRIDDNEAVAKLSKSEIGVYTPNLYKNGEPFESKNLLSANFFESYYVSNPYEIANYTDGLTYKILDADKKLCALSRILTPISGDVYIPSFTEINGERYSVVGISSGALCKKSNITAVYVSEGIESIADNAFSNCSYLAKVVIPDSVTSIGEYAFGRCGRLSEVYIGIGVKEFGPDVFGDTNNITSFNYAGSSADLSRVAGSEQLADISITYLSEYTGISVRVPVMTKENIIVNYVSIGDTPIESDFYSNGRYILFSLEDKGTLVGKTIKIHASFSDNPRNRILGCKTSTVFDGRVFVSGNPNYPSDVFCSETMSDGELYFPEKNTISDGLGYEKVVSLCSLENSLIVFKAGDDGEGAIFFHEKREGYPVKDVIGGVRVLGAAVNFNGETVFPSNKGLLAIKTVGDRKVLSPRSTKINSLFRTEKASSFCYTEWCGYLVIESFGRIYLGDPRGDGEEYDWYILEGIGSYGGDSLVYRYSSHSTIAALKFHEKTGERVSSEYTISSARDKKGNVCYYVNIGGIRYAVEKTNERTGGTFSRARLVMAIDDVLVFITVSGTLCVFNNDMRGIAPAEISSAPGFVESEYKAEYSGRIHPYYYNFASHAVNYEVVTPLDDCGIYYLEKEIIRDSLVMKLKCFERSCVDLSVLSDGYGVRALGRINLDKFSFYELDFANLTFLPSRFATVAVPDCERGFVERSIRLSSDEYNAPFGFIAANFGYKPTSKIQE